MQFKGMALVASVLVLTACGGGETKSETPVATPAEAPAAAPAAAPASAPAATGTAAPITGKMIEIKMVGDAKGFRYEPSIITAKVGDGLKFVMESGGPHNVAFEAAMIPAGAAAQLDANFGTDKIGPLSSGLKMQPGEIITISLGGLPAGKYEFNCTPHLAMNMKGTLTITP